MHARFRDGFDNVNASTAERRKRAAQPALDCFWPIRTQVAGERHGGAPLQAAKLGACSRRCRNAVAGRNVCTAAYEFDWEIKGPL